MPNINRKEIHMKTKNKTLRKSLELLMVLVTLFIIFLLPLHQ